MDDTQKRGGQDRDRISLSQEHELDYWTEKFGVSRDELRDAVETVGNDADKVEQYLNEE